MTTMIKYDNETYVKTCCKDCGKGFLHNSPRSTAGNLFKFIFEDVLFTVNYLYWAKHYLVIWKSVPERVFFTCEKTAEELQKGDVLADLIRWIAIGEGD
jgi:hypothetical protein